MKVLETTNTEIPISKFPWETLSNLTVLYIGNRLTNQRIVLQESSPWIEQLPCKLKELGIHGYDISCLDSFCRFEELTTLDLSTCILTGGKKPQKIGKMTTLRLKSAFINPGWLQSLQNQLIVLDVGSCHGLPDNPATLGTLCQSIEELYVDHVSIYFVWESLKSIGNLL